MAYIDIVTLAEAKEYLRVDDTLTEDDAQITRMINTALSKIEKNTNNYVFSRNKTYTVVDGCVRVYDYPINSIVTTGDITVKKYNLYNVYILIGEELELNIGHDLPTDVPDAFSEIALELVKMMYYEQQTNQKTKESLPMWAVELLDQYKRFIV